MSAALDLENTVLDVKYEHASQTVFPENPRLKTATPRPTHYAEYARHAFLDGLPESFDSPDQAIRAGYRTLTDWCDLLEVYRARHAALQPETIPSARDPCAARPRPRPIHFRPLRRSRRSRSTPRKGAE